ncbi:winged helix-turn-helix transcriptional regulator [Nonomuraea rosea]|uniref:winged helix-turn-helix transcriptional regulator n=1 Tax=Nonomuraea rosea TaxID=638574 RepID=UPI0031EFD15F
MTAAGGRGKNDSVSPCRARRGPPVRRVPSEARRGEEHPRRTLVDAGILTIVPASGGGAHHEYVLTPEGEALRPVIAALRHWGEQNCAPGTGSGA